jgi:hypothetical protein
VRNLPAKDVELGGMTTPVVWRRNKHKENKVTALVLALLNLRQNVKKCGLLDSQDILRKYI